VDNVHLNARAARNQDSEHKIVGIGAGLPQKHVE
jgi:hypothetical protein